MQENKDLNGEDNFRRDDSAQASPAGSSDLRQHIKTLDKGQKIGVIVLAFFAFLVIVMWIAQFNRSLTSPFEYKGADSGTAVSGTDKNDNDLQTKDTDGDGLSDYDELNYYKTSPYLEDSDSDGFSDSEEIASGNDPNCPTGRDCYADSGIEDPGTATENFANTVDPAADRSSFEALLNQMGSETGTAPSDTTSMDNLLSGDVSASELRTMLIDAGMDKAILDQIPDDELMSSFKDVLGGQQ